MIKISNSTSENKPQWQSAEPIEPARLTQPRAPDQAADATAQASPARFGRILAIVGRVLLSWLTTLPGRLGDRLFVMNDTEAYWRGWQITKTHGGLARRYRDPQFDTLAECPKCHGAGATRATRTTAGATRATAGGAGLTADLPCVPCLGTGRITLGEVS